MGGTYIRELNTNRGGQTEHACMPGCLIKCSNVYVDNTGREIVSPMEYETICLLGTNCGLEDPDDVARMNEIANDLGVDSIELGAPSSILSTPRSFAISFILATSSGSSNPQFVPRRQIVSYSIGETISLPVLST